MFIKRLSKLWSPYFPRLRPLDMLLLVLAAVFFLAAPSVFAQTAPSREIAGAPWEDRPQNSPQAYVEPMLLVDMSVGISKLLFTAHIEGRVALSLITNEDREIVGLNFGLIEGEAVLEKGGEPKRKQSVHATLPLGFFDRKKTEYRVGPILLFAIDATDLKSRTGGELVIEFMKLRPGGMHRHVFYVERDEAGSWRLLAPGVGSTAEDRALVYKIRTPSYPRFATAIPEPIVEQVDADKIWGSRDKRWRRKATGHIEMWKYLMSIDHEAASKTGIESLFPIPAF